MILQYSLIFNSVLPIAQKPGDILESNKSFFVFFIISFLLLISLWGTFYHKATSIHKVLALLSLSILTVFLWMWETHFLFIYLVYILAFIGAVLMLFLSVVLILPISTISINYNFFLWASTITIFDKVDLAILHPLTSPDNVSFRPPGFNDLKNFGDFKFSLFDNLVLEINYLIFVTLLIMGYYCFIQIFWLFRCQLQSNIFNLKLINYYINNFKKDYRSFLYNQIAGHCCVNIGGQCVPAWIILRHKAAYSSEMTLFSSPSYVNLTFFTFVTLETPWFIKLSSFFKLSSSRSFFFIAVFNMFVILLACLYYFIIIASRELWFKFLFFWKCIFSSLLNRKNIGEYFIQILLFLGFFFIAIPVFYKPSATVYITSLLSDNSGGLDNLKILLYEQASPFLLASTLVLLVALIGAAVITKNKS